MFAGRFVTLKLVTDGNPDWSKWARRYPVDGNGIPRLYVVRADGEQLYAGVGSLGREALPRMLRSTLLRSGRIFTDQETALLKSCVERAEKAMAAEDYGRVAGELSKLAKLGTLGELNSYSELALKADKLAATVRESFDATLEEAVESLQQEETAFAAALVLADADRQYAGFKQLQRRVDAALKAAQRDEAVRPYLLPATALARARTLAESERRSVRRRAAEAYRAVSRRYPDTEADKLAREELAALTAEKTDN